MAKNRRRPAARIACRKPTTKSLKFETLEPRQLLAANSASGLDDTVLAENFAGYSDDRIIVVMHQKADKAPSQSLVATTIAGRPTLDNGRVLGTSVKLMEGIYSVELAEGVSVDFALQKFARRVYVAHAARDYLLKPHAVPKDPMYGDQWGLNNKGQTGGKPNAHIAAQRAWNTHTGSGNTIIAIIDSGVEYTHPDLVDNIWVNPGEIAGNGIDDDGNGFIDDVYGWDFGDFDNEPLDTLGHGTHVAGIAAAQGNNGVGVSGVNWDAQIMSLKIQQTGFFGLSTAAAIQAIDYAVRMGAKIINASWGGYLQQHQPLYLAVSRARSQGVIFVAAAGNANLNHDQVAGDPSDYKLDNVVSVAASDHNDVLADFSDYGRNSVHIAAPGVDILSTVPMLQGGYDYFSGTSMAAPMVAGAMALIWDAYPDLTYQQVIDVVLNNVTKAKDLRKMVSAGGRLNVFRALQAAGEIEPGAIESVETMQASNNRRKAIATGATTRSSLTIDSNFTIADVNVWVNVKHGAPAKLRMTLYSPNKEVIVNLVHRSRGQGRNFSMTVFDDSAKISIQKGAAPYKGSFSPRTPLSALKGINARGTWKLVLKDFGTKQPGTLEGWGLVIGGVPGTPRAVAAMQQFNSLPTFLSVGSSSASSSPLKPLAATSASLKANPAPAELAAPTNLQPQFVDDVFSDRRRPAVFDETEPDFELFADQGDAIWMGLSSS